LTPLSGLREGKPDINVVSAMTAGNMNIGVGFAEMVTIISKKFKVKIESGNKIPRSFVKLGMTAGLSAIGALLSIQFVRRIRVFRVIRVKCDRYISPQWF
jgi:hypothetical protein